MISLTDGAAPLVVSMPHVGRELPAEIAGRMTDAGREIADTDWWIDRLYRFAGELGAAVVAARVSRYVIDLNRDPSGQSLYPGQATTGLCPVETFDGVPLYRKGAEPDEAEMAERRARYFDPYHAALADLLKRAVSRFGYALLYDAHSIRSHVPRLFDGELPVFNIGTNGGASCAPRIEAGVVRTCAEAKTYSHVANGRFRGGWITRHYGRPDRHVHAVQMELAQRAYMQEAAPWTFDEEKAGRLRPVLRRVLEGMLHQGRELYGA